jgi:hypothetical protein
MLGLVTAASFTTKQFLKASAGGALAGAGAGEVDPAGGELAELDIAESSATERSID